MKTKEELNAIKEEYENMQAKLAQLSEEELVQVIGGINGRIHRRIYWDKPQKEKKED